ncbi:ATP-DEPENDENT RNA HELICASE [Salix viminalis]|uniref:RNA helicase n=1 Tax=Salix viminalis TaxID=40686 RepID=A0A9Q0NW70_SALVM|nr:ATP-DEPENDENT RNA HELICASE [Salix viminalis]
MGGTRSLDRSSKLLLNGAGQNHSFNQPCDGTKETETPNSWKGNLEGKPNEFPPADTERTSVPWDTPKKVDTLTKAKWKTITAEEKKPCEEKYKVIVVSGETGCGKTTQLPQYILEYEIEAARGAACSIICTQPRRISAMSVSERVAAERGEKLGESVGYKVRLEGMRGRDTRLLFCTTGILLRRLLLDRDLKGVTHVIVDEIHERGMNEDFLLIVLRDLLPRRPELRLILMSATLNADLFSSYFGGAPAIHIPVSLTLLISVLITCRKPIPYPLKPAGKDLVNFAA